MRRSARAVVPTLGLLLATAFAAPAQADTLVGESLLSDQRHIQADCNPEGDSTINFTASGVATGPHPGTFTERGTAVIGPQTESSGIPGDPLGFFGDPVGSVNRFDVEFEITADDGTRITGTKRGTAVQGYCDPDRVFFGADFLRRGIIFAQPDLTYEARFEGPSGSSTETGRAVATLTQFGPSLDGADPALESIYEDFYQRSSPVPDPTPPPVAIPDRPGQGCGDRNHVHTQESDCKQPRR